MNYCYNLKEYDRDQEFRNILNRHLLPLLGMVKDDGSGEINYITEGYTPKKEIALYNGRLYFSPTLSAIKGYRIQVNSDFRDDYLAAVRSVYTEIKKVTYNDFGSSSVKRKYETLSDVEYAYEGAVQKGIINWFFISYIKSKENNIKLKNRDDLNLSDIKPKINRLCDLLEKWSKKTYEGKKVPFAFVINPNSSSGTIDYLDFLSEEYSATLSDGINSIIELDINLKLKAYNSITQDNVFDKIDLSTAVPYRFSQVIQNFTKDKLGIFLLISGDIILAKDGKIELVKREGTWLNFSRDIFIEVLLGNNDTKNKVKLNKEVLEAVYATSLDVSFSHGGGIIAITDEVYKLIKNNDYDYIKNNYNELDFINNFQSKDKSIIDYIDYLKNDLLTYSQLSKKYPKIFKKSDEKLMKRFNKREIVKFLVNNKFQYLDRKLRTELVGMDGATIINSSGDVLAVGAIIQNESGSYGGGRGAAAKKLSKYGLAIKISTDGYIEVYENEKIKYRIK